MRYVSNHTSFLPTITSQMVSQESVSQREHSDLTEIRGQRKFAGQIIKRGSHPEKELQKSAQKSVHLSLWPNTKPGMQDETP